MNQREFRKIDVQITWIEFEELIQEEAEGTKEVLQKLLRITEDTEKQKKLFFCLVKAFNIEKNKFDVSKFKSLLKELRIKHLEKKVILKLPGEVK